MSARRWLRVLAAMFLGLAVFLFGFLAGRLGASDHDANQASSVLDEALGRIQQSAAGPVEREALVHAAIQGMLGSLHDKYATYYGASDFRRFQSMLEGRYGGVGLWLRLAPGGAIEVASVLPDSPAATAGLVRADRIERVGGRAVAGTGVSGVVAMLRGDSGTTVTVQVRRSGALLSLSLRRAEVSVSDVTVDRPVLNVGRIRIAAFTRGVGRDVRAALATLRAAGVPSVILDLRGNPGGLLGEGVEVASAFLDGGPVVSYRTREGAPQVFDAIGHGDTTTSLALLVDGGTASAAEVVAGALQDRRRAVIVGSQTFGKGSVQEPLRLSDGSAVELTVARYSTPSGRTLDGIGVTPDIDVDASAGSAAALQRAIETLAGLVADVGTPRG